MKLDHRQVLVVGQTLDSISLRITRNGSVSRRSRGRTYEKKRRMDLVSAHLFADEKCSQAMLDFLDTTDFFVSYLG